MSKYSDSLSRLNELKNGKGIQYLLNAAYETLGNPICMIDVGYNLLAKTENRVTDDVLWNELTSRGIHSHNTIHLFKTEGFFTTAEKADTVALLKSDKIKYSRMVGKLFDDNNMLIGDVIVIECYKPFTLDDYRFVKAICKMIEAELQTSKIYPKITRLLNRTVTNEILDGYISESQHNIPTSIRKKMEKLYKNLKKNIYIGVVDIGQYDPTFAHVAYFRNLFEKMQCEYKFFDAMYNIGIIISSDHLFLSAKRDLQVFYDFFAMHGMYAGISSSFDNLYEMKKYYQQALSALNIGMMENSSQFIFMYDDFLLDNLMSKIEPKIKTPPLCHPLVSKIQKMDHENNTNYSSILYCYLVNGRNSKKSALKIKMDHEKFCKSLKEIELFCEIDWNNGNTLASLLMSFKLINDDFTTEE